MKAIFKLNFDCGRSGALSGVFVSTQERVNALINSGVDVYFGEVLGKHSEVFGPIEESEVEFITDDPNFIEIFEKHGLETGFDPFNYNTIHGESIEDYVTNLLKQ